MSSKGYRLHLGHASKKLAFTVLIFSGLMFSKSALAANITVASPVNGTSVTSPIWVRAHNVGCDGLAPTAFGYSVDNSGTLVRGVTSYDIDATNVGIASGTHTIHFKAWTSKGICPVVNTTFTVKGGSGSAASGDASASATVTSIPANAINSGNLDGKAWISQHDTGTPGSSKGSTVFPANTPSYDSAREFYMTFSGSGGERWHISFANDASPTHFVYDTYIYVTDPSKLGNVELDMNQVMSNGKTVIYGTQCSTYTKTWEYTYQSGDNFHWKSSNIGCNPKSWAANSWHHIQIASHRDSSGNVTYDWVNFDGGHYVFKNATVNSAKSLGWAKGTLLINYQLDGAGSGSITSYIHNMTIYRW